MLLAATEYVRPASLEEALAALGASARRARARRRPEPDQRPQAPRRERRAAGRHQPPAGAARDRACAPTARLDGRRLRSPTTSSSARPRCATAQPCSARSPADIEDRQMRNRGTIGGNCCFGDPTNNLPPLLVALGATMDDRRARLASAQVAAEEFFFGFFATAVEQGEMLREHHDAAARAGRRRRLPARSQSPRTRGRSCERQPTCAPNETIEAARVVLGVRRPRRRSAHTGDGGAAARRRRDRRGGRGRERSDRRRASSPRAMPTGAPTTGGEMARVDGAARAVSERDREGGAAR